MRRFVSSSLAAGLLLLIGSCGRDLTVAPDGLLQTRARFFSALPDVRISEIHYDNTGTDAGERIEVSGPTGTDLTGWSIVLYNGSNGTVYDTDALSGTIPASCESNGASRGVVVLAYPSNGIQNGAPDGIALVNSSGAAVEFLSYEGGMSGVGGPANGLPATDILASQSGSEPLESSLQRSGSDTWTATLGFNSFGVCNDHEVPPPPAEVASVTVEPAGTTVIVGGSQGFTAKAFDVANNELPGATFTWASSDEAIATVSATGVATGVSAGDAEIRATSGGHTGTASIHVDAPVPEPEIGTVYFSEFHYDNDGADTDERIEVAGPPGLNLSGWKIVLYNATNGASYATLNLSGVLGDQCSGTGLLSFAALGMQNGPSDGLALVSPSGTVFEFLSYEGTLTATNGEAAGRLSIDVGRSEGGSEAPGRSLQKDALGWYGPSRATFDACNVATPFISLSSRGDLPVGFESQLFASYDNGRGDETPTTFSWVAESPGVVSVDQDGVVHANAVGSGVIQAIAEDGTIGKSTVTVRDATLGTTASYGNHTEFGSPRDKDSRDDFIVRRAQYTSSYNKNRGIPNWVSYNLEASHFGSEDRCDCFTFDPQLPASFTHYTTADYTGAGTAAGYGIDRGHLARSFDRTTGVLDNATTFYFTNIIPQASDNNQGPWSAMEIAIGDKARFENMEVYVIAGASGSKGTVKDEGIITIPASVWKVAVLMPRDQGLKDAKSYDNLEVVAAIMPNDPGIRNVDWNTYRTTVNAVEKLSGYDVLALLKGKVESVIETGMKDVITVVDGMVVAGTLKPWLGAALTARLEAAADGIEDGEIRLKQQHLTLINRWLDGLVTGGHLDAASATALKDAIAKVFAGN